MSKVYSPEETAEILKIAAENSHSTPPEESVGLSELELKDIARESGINPKEIDRAIAHVSQSKASSSRGLWGGPFVFAEQFEVDHEITSAEWEVLLAEIRTFFRSKGDVSKRENVYEWSSPWDTTNAAHVTALVDSGRTHVSVSWSGPLTPVPFFIPVPLVTIATVLLASGPLGLESLAGLSLAAGATFGSFALARWAVKRHMVKGFDQLRDFVGALKDKAAKNSSKADPPSTTGESEIDTRDGSEGESSEVVGSRSGSLGLDPGELDGHGSDSGAADRRRSRE